MTPDQARLSDFGNAAGIAACPTPGNATLRRARHGTAAIRPNYGDCYKLYTNRADEDVNI